MEKSEGYVKYNAQHTDGRAIQVPCWEKLNDARSRLFELGLVGVMPDGIGYGNVSIRYRGNEFLVSGTATGALPRLGPENYCLVSSFDIERNTVVSEGPVRSSSEAMTHGAVYKACPWVQCVMHIHSRSIFDGMLREKYPSTPKSAGYGTPEIALAIAKCAAENSAAREFNAGAILLAGHDEGIIAYGAAVENTFNIIYNLYNEFSLFQAGG